MTDQGGSECECGRSWMHGGSGAGSTADVLFSNGLSHQDMLEALHAIRQLRADLAAARAEVQRLTEQRAEWESFHTADVEMRGLIESHMDTARSQWQCVAEVQQLTEVLAAARHFQGAVKDAMAHQVNCQDSPCDRCDRTVFVEDAAESALFDALDRLDAADKARTATPEGPLSAPSSAPPPPEQAT